MGVFYVYALMKVGADFYASKKFDRTYMPSHFFSYDLCALLDGIEANSGWWRWKKTSLPFCWGGAEKCLAYLYVLMKVAAGLYTPTKFWSHMCALTPQIDFLFYKKIQMLWKIRNNANNKKVTIAHDKEESARMVSSSYNAI